MEWSLDGQYQNEGIVYKTSIQMDGPNKKYTCTFKKDFIIINQQSIHIVLCSLNMSGTLKTNMA